MPKQGSSYDQRPALPANSRALKPQVVVAAGLLTFYDLERQVDGDDEARAALLLLAYGRLVEEAEDARAEIEKTTGLTKLQAERVIADRLERNTLVKRFGEDWLSKTSRTQQQIDKRAGVRQDAV